LVFELDTSGGGLPYPGLPFHRVFWHFRTSSSRSEIMDLHSYPGGRNFSQEGLDLTLEGKKLILYFSSACYPAFGGLYLHILSIL
jgi:hypothetical protein